MPVSRRSLYSCEDLIFGWAYKLHALNWCLSWSARGKETRTCLDEVVKPAVISFYVLLVFLYRASSALCEERVSHRLQEVRGGGRGSPRCFSAPSCCSAGHGEPSLCWAVSRGRWYLGVLLPQTSAPSWGGQTLPPCLVPSWRQWCCMWGSVCFAGPRTGGAAELGPCSELGPCTLWAPRSRGRGCASGAVADAVTVLAPALPCSLGAFQNFMVMACCLSQ